MAIESKVNNRWIKDPLFSVIKKFLLGRKSLITSTGDLTERLLADYRYSGMEPDQFVIETPCVSPEGVKRVCFTRRDKAFARIDTEFEPVRLRNIMDDFKVPYVLVMDQGEFIQKFIAKEIQGKLLYLAWRDSFGVCVNNDEAQDLVKINELLGDVYFNHLALNRDEDSAIDPDTLTSGFVSIQDQSCSDSVIRVFVKENVTELLGLAKIDHNLPETLVGRRGETIKHLLKLTVAGVDVTAQVTMSVVAKNGNVVCTRSDNKLELISKFVRGSYAEVMDDELTVNMSMGGGEDIYTRTVVVPVTIEMNTANMFELDFVPVVMDFPIKQRMGIRVVPKYEGNVVPFTKVPTTLTTLVGGAKLVNRGVHRAGGVYFTSDTVISQPGSVVRDVLISEDFMIFQGGKTQTARLLTDINYLPENAAAGVLTVSDLSPTQITGKLGDVSTINLVTSDGGEVLPSIEVIVPTGQMGPKRLLRFDTYEANKINYTIINNSGIAGEPISDTVNFTATHIGRHDGVLKTAALTVYPTVSFPSVVEVTPKFPDPISANRYDYGEFPFNVTINGKPATTVKSVQFTDPANLVKPYVYADPNKMGQWQVLGLANTNVDTEVSFTVTVTADGIDQVFVVKKLFKIPKYEGTNVVGFPNPIIGNVKSGVEGFVEMDFYRDGVLINNLIKVLPDDSVVPPGTSLGTTSVLPNGKCKFTFTGVPIGTQNLTVAFGTGTVFTVNSAVKIPMTMNVEAGEEVTFLVDSLNKSKPGLPAKLFAELYYRNEKIPLTDPRVSIKMYPKVVGNIGIKDVGVIPDYITYVGTDNPPMGITSTFTYTVETHFTKDNGSLYEKFTDVDLQFERRGGFTYFSFVETQPIPPNQTDYVVKVKLTDSGNDPVEFCFLDTMSVVGIDGAPSPIASYRNQLVRTADPLAYGVYEIKVSTNALGGEFKFNLKGGLGGARFVFTQTGNSHIDSAPMKLKSNTTVLALENLVTNVEFTVKQDRPGELNKPIVITRTENVRFDNTSYSEVGLIKPTGTVGTYTVQLTSTGKKGDSQIVFDMVTTEGSLEKVWKDVVLIVTANA